jgi:hypothetical protein
LLESHSKYPTAQESNYEEEKNQGKEKSETTYSKDRERGGGIVRHAKAVGFDKDQIFPTLGVVVILVLDDWIQRVFLAKLLADQRREGDERWPSDRTGVGRDSRGGAHCGGNRRA